MGLHRLLICSPSQLQGPMTHGLHSGPVGSLFRSPELQKLLLWGACLFLASLALDLGAQVASRALWYPKEPHWLLGASRAVVTDDTFWDHETYICMTHLGDPRATLYSRGPHGHQRVSLTLALGAPLDLRAPASFRGPTVTKRSR